MTYTTPGARAASRRRPFNPGRRHRTNFARQITITEFGWKFARSLDQADFIDRTPGELPMSSPEARFK